MLTIQGTGVENPHIADRPSIAQPLCINEINGRHFHDENSVIGKIEVDSKINGNETRVHEPPETIEEQGKINDGSTIHTQQQETRVVPVVVESPPRPNISKKLSTWQIKEKKLPHDENSVWFHRQRDAFDYDQPPNPTAGYVSYDQRKADGKISKVYAVFSSFDSYFKAEDKLEQQQKNGCELIRLNHPCRLYSDVEWTINLDLASEPQPQFEVAVKNADEYMAIWLQSLNHQLATYFGVDPTHIVLRGSRIKSDTVMKMSYHVIIENLAFTCNHDGAMQAVFESVPFPDMPGVTKNPIDLLVYTSNRNIRMIGCGKLSERYNPLVFHPGLSSRNDLKSKLDTLLTYNIPAEIIVDPNDLSNFPNFAQIYKKPSSNKVRAATTSTQRAAASSTDRSQMENLLPVLKELLEIKGDKKTKVTSFNGNGNNGALKFQCVNSSARRECQCSGKHSHLTNNCLLIVERDLAEIDGPEKAVVKYVCMSGKCKPHNICTLGHISSPDGHHWTIAIPQDMGVIAGTDGLNSTIAMEVEPPQSDDENISVTDLAELDRTIMMELEMQPPIGISTRERCSRELCLMASFPLGDPRTEKVFSVLKSLDPTARGQDYFMEWCSRNPNIDMTDATKLFDDASPYYGDAKSELHRIRTENPAVVYLKTILTLPGDQTTKDIREKAKDDERKRKAEEKDHERKRKAEEKDDERKRKAEEKDNERRRKAEEKDDERKRKAEEKEAKQNAGENNRKKKKINTTCEGGMDVASEATGQAKTACEGEMDMASEVTEANTACEGEMDMASEATETNTADPIEEAEPAKKIDPEMRRLHQFLHSVDFEKTEWGSLLSVAYQIFRDEEVCSVIFDLIAKKFKTDVLTVKTVWDCKRGPCGQWPDLINKNFAVLCSKHKLITKTIPEIFGTPVFCYDVVTEMGCMVLRFTLDNSAYTQHDLNLSTGLIDDSTSQNLLRLESIDMGACSIGDFLLELGLDQQLGMHAEDYRVYQPSNGKWQLIDEKEAHRFVRDKLHTQFSRCLNLYRFRSDHGFPQEQKAMYDVNKAMITFCETPKGVGEVLHFIRCKIQITQDERPYMVCFENGMVDLRTGKLLGPAKPSDHVLLSIPNVFDPDADCTIMLEYLRSLFPEELYPDSDGIIAFIQQHLGACLINAQVAPAMLNFVGEGANGKSIYLKLMSKAFGEEYHSTIPAEALARPVCENNDALYKARLARSATISEFDPKVKINDKQLKNLTGGDKTFFIGKFKTGEDRISNMTIQAFSNDSATFTTNPANDFALKRRLALLPTRARFLGPNDDDERRKLITEEHSNWIFQKDEAFVANVLKNGVPAFLAFAVEGAGKILGRENYDIEMPPTIRNATEREYGRDKSDMLKDFVKSELRQSQSSFVSTAEIIQVYKKLYDLESCLNKSGVFATQLKTAIKDVFLGFAACDGFKVDDCKKRVDSPEGRKEVRGYLNADWVPGRQAAGIAAELRKTYFS